MRVFPQTTGALIIQDILPETVYDMGNASIYAQIDATGRISTAQRADGVPLQTIVGARYYLHTQTEPAGIASIADVIQALNNQYKATFSEGAGKRTKTVWEPDESQTLHFGDAQAIGRTWTLSGQRRGLAVSVTTFMDRTSPAVFQQIEILNESDEMRIFGLDLALSLKHTRGYAGAGTASAGRIHIDMHSASVFGATIQPWQVVMDKVQTTIRYAVPVAPRHKEQFCLVTTSGDDTTLDHLLEHWQESRADADDYADQLRVLADSDDPLIQSLIVAGVNASFSSYKKLPSGVGGFLAGVSYAYPPRAYFRDGYWTAQAALIVQPDMVRDHILWLAHGVGANGMCPSGVWDPGLFTERELDSPEVLHWITDHYDSPSFFVMLLHDYVVASRDLGILDMVVGAYSLWEHATHCMDYLTAQDQDGDGLFEKPHAANDWADNVMRDALVTYDLALYYRALMCMAALAKLRNDTATSRQFEAQADRVRTAINQNLWDNEQGYYVAYKRLGFTETHLSIDSLLTVLYGVADAEQAMRSLKAARQMLQTRNNTEQVHGDWGVMCCYPFYHEPADLFSISAEPYRYHNGADWPYWDGLYGLILLQRGDPDWQYVLTRWWEVSLAQGWLTPVEYYAPPHPHGGLLQGWSSMPAVALLYKKYVTWFPHIKAR